MRLKLVDRDSWSMTRPRLADEDQVAHCKFRSNQRNSRYDSTLQVLVEPVDRQLLRLLARLTVNPIVLDAR